MPGDPTFESRLWRASLTTLGLFTVACGAVLVHSLWKLVRG
jgi:hypothetical protein